MVQRAACSSETSASLNGARNGDREGETSGVVVATDAVDVGPRGVVTSDVGETSLTRGGGRFSLFRWFKRNRDSTVEKQRRTGSARPNDDDNVIRQRRSSVYSSVESVDTFYSTTTVRSFAFHAGTLGRCDVLSLDILKQAAEVGPFAAGASKVSVSDKENIAAVASTLPTNAHSRRRDITARYSLHPSTTFGSCGNFPTPGAGLSRRHDERARVTCNASTRRRVHVKGKRRAPNPPGAVVKVAEVDARETPARHSSGRRKRRAPRPPLGGGNRPAEEQSRLVIDGGGDMEIEERMRNADEGQSISNDTLVLQGGMLLSKKEVCNRELSKSARNDEAGASGAAILPERAHSPIGTLSAAMPRPWYKRSVFEHSRDSGPSSKRGAVFRGSVESTKEETCVGASLTAAGTNYSVDASLSRLNFFHRAERQSDDRKRQEVKRKSGLSILTNISELDKEAAAIVQEEQARTRASMLSKASQFADAFEKSNDANEEIVQDIVASAMESSSPRRSTRALISKFNAISNITKVTVNANFFARRDQPGGRLDRDAARSSRCEQIGDWGNQRAQRDLGQNVVRVDKDISRYFLPQQRPSRGKSEAARADAKPTDIKITIKEQNDQLMQDASDRISLLQSQLAANRANEIRKDVILPVTEEKIRSRQELGGERKGKEAARLNSEISRRFLLSRARNLAESTEHALGLYRGRAERGGERPEGTRKEFSDIFDEIDRQLRSREFELIERRPAVESDSGGRATKVPEDEAASSKVAKVLDILVEAEKDGKTRSAIQSARSIPGGETSHLIDSDQKAKSCKTKSTVLNTVEGPITADLKEMLKEMKHSLPKRPKPRKVTSNDDDGVLEKVEKRSPVSANKTYVAPVTSTDAAPSNDYEADKQKVSSSVQTSGNIRRLNQPSAAAERPSTSGWRHENVLYRTSGKGSALVKNTFQLIRPRDFAEIEAMKTTREVYKENTYANVIEPSLYANAHVPPASPKQRPDPTRSKDIPQSSNAKVPPNIAIEKKIALNEDEFTEEGNISEITVVYIRRQ